MKPISYALTLFLSVIAPVNQRPPEIPEPFWEEIDPGAKERTVIARAAGPDGAAYFLIGTIQSNGEGGGTFVLRVQRGEIKTLFSDSGYPNLSKIGLPQAVADSLAEQELARRLEKGGEKVFNRLRNQIEEDDREARKWGWSSGELADPAYVKAYKKFGLVRSDFSPPPPAVFRNGRYIPESPTPGE